MLPRCRCKQQIEMLDKCCQHFDPHRQSYHCSYLNKALWHLHGD